MTGELAARFTSGSQKAGNVTEAWGSDNFYCPNCSSPKLDWLKRNTKASDYCCPNCGFWFQLKSKKTRIGKSIRDGAYGAMMEAIKEDRAPSYFFLHYDLATWRVKNLLLIPHFAFPPSAIIKCPPLSSTARRAGWVGCNFDLNRIPVEARISIVTESQVLPANEVRQQFRRVKPLKELSITERGWTLDVLNVVRRLPLKVGDEVTSLKSRTGTTSRLLQPSQSYGATGTSSPTTEFTTADVYAFEHELEKLHPGNRHVRDKIRQQLQVLRDAGLLIHVERGLWRLP